MTWPTPIPGHWLFTIPDRAPILSPYRGPDGFRENCVRVSAGTSEYLTPAVSQWWEFGISRADAIGLHLPCLALVTKPAEEFTSDMTGHETVALVEVRPTRPLMFVSQGRGLALRVIDGRTWHATGRGTQWPPPPIPIPDDWPIYGVRAAGEKVIRQSMPDLMKELRASLGDLPARQFDSEGGIRKE